MNYKILLIILIILLWLFAAMAYENDYVRNNTDSNIENNSEFLDG